MAGTDSNKGGNRLQLAREGRWRWQARTCLPSLESQKLRAVSRRRWVRADCGLPGEAHGGLPSRPFKGGTAPVWRRADVTYDKKQPCIGSL